MDLGAGKEGDETESDASEVHGSLLGPPIAGTGSEGLSPRLSWQVL